MRPRRELRLPASLTWLDSVADGRDWLRSLPSRLAAACDRWDLAVDAPYDGSYVSLVLPARRVGDESLVLKLNFPHRESAHEGSALRAWDGDGAVRRVDEAPELGALLIERCTPGTHLADAGVATALEVLEALVPRLAVPVGEPFTSLADEARRWAANLPSRWDAAGRPFERSLVDRAIALLHELADTSGADVLVHQDLHAGNVLRAEREPWLAIDPKPLRGEPAFALAPVIRSYELGHGRRHVQHRLDRLTEAVGVDRARARDWCFAQTVAWSLEGSAALPRHVETARWLLTM